MPPSFRHFLPGHSRRGPPEDNGGQQTVFFNCLPSPCPFYPLGVVARQKLFLPQPCTSPHTADWVETDDFFLKKVESAQNGGKMPPTTFWPKITHTMVVCPFLFSKDNNPERRVPRVFPFRYFCLCPWHMVTSVRLHAPGRGGHNFEVLRELFFGHSGQRARP